MNGKVTYHQQVSYCGKPRCRKCREGTGHGPYWYRYQTIEGRTTRTYIGKHLPPEVQETMEGYHEPPSSHSGEREQSTIRIYTLGQFRLERRSGRDASEWQTVTDSAWQHQRVRSLLCSLVSSNGRKLGREQIMDALWPDLDMETAASRLDRAVYSLRQIFEPSRGRLATSPLLLTEREMIVLAEHPQVWIDSDVFDQLLVQAHAAPDPGEKERLLEEAATLYGGDFLPEERKLEATLARRDALRRSWIGLLLDLADLRIAREALNSAIDPLDRLMSIDPTNEAAVQRLISLLAQLGRRGEALRAYKRLATVLQQEYRIAPLPETRALYEAVRSGADKLPSQRTSISESGATSAVTRADTASNAAPSPAIQIGRTHQSPLVGREEEIELLRMLVTETERAAKFKLAAQKKTSLSSLDTQRRPQSVLLLGDVGIGKTRLAEEISRDAKKRGWAVAWSRVYAQEGSIPYRLWTEVLRKAMAQGAWQRQEVKNRPLVFQPLVSLLPELHELLSHVAISSSLPPEQEQLRLWEAARELLTIISDSTPLLIALDDLQWADGSSCELLAYLARRLQNHPIVIVGTCRENELGANHPLRPLLTDLQRENAVETVQLQPLSDEQISMLVSQVSQVAEPVMQRISTRAAGNPFFAEELARSIGAQPSLSAHSGDSETALPETITAVLDLRLNRLNPACHRLLNKAAVLGGSFEFHVINEMEASTPGSSEDVVLDLLEEALRSGMLTEEGTGTRITYHFWHPLLVNHLYEALSAARRASLHRRAAEIFRQVYHNREEEGAATITHHLVAGGADPQQIAHYAELAGNRAYAFSSYPDAEKFYRITLEHLGYSVDRSIAALSPEEQLHFAYLLECLGECTRIQGNNEQARNFYEQALHMRGRCYETSSLNEQEAQIQALLWCEIGVTWYNVGNTAQARQCFQRGEQVLQDAKVTTNSAWGYLRYQQSYASWREGGYKEARITALEALELFEGVVEQREYSAGHKTHLTLIRRTLAGDPVNLGRTHSLLGLIAASGSRYVEALTHLNMALTLFEQYDSQREIAIVCCNLGDVHMRKAEHSLAQAFFRRSLSIAERIGEMPLVSFIFGNLGVLDTHCGNLDEAEDEFKKGITLAERSNDPVHLSMWYAYLATVLQKQGRLPDAEAALGRALTIGRTIHIAPYKGLALVTLGSIRITQAMFVGAERNNSQASEEMLRNLKRARKTLQHALSLESMEAETRTEGQLAMAQVMLLLGEIDAAQQLAEQTLEKARQFELTWLIARTQQVLGGILEACGQQRQASEQFELALRTFRRHGMRLECGHTLQLFGEVLIQRDSVGGKQYQCGLGYLREAQQIFKDCNAVANEQLVKQILARYENVSKI
ncbi:MAG TPA: DUF6788 family protein [Ktedonobacteraceae bacterium]|nr:DUF6788 family protein [Ktedonobacteraceae bacterium]